MDNIDEKQHSKSFLEVRKRKVSSLVKQEEIQTIQKRTQPEQHVPSQSSSDYKRAKEDQLESYIQHLETKNKSLLAKVTDLSSQNKKLTEENVELQNQQKLASSSGSIPSRAQSVYTESKAAVDKPERSFEILDTQALVALWDEISSIPLPHCSCSKLQGPKRKKANMKQTSIKHIKLECRKNLEPNDVNYF